MSASIIARDEPGQLGWFETVVLLGILFLAAVAIGLLTMGSAIGRWFMPSDTSFAGPYRQVR